MDDSQITPVTTTIDHLAVARTRVCEQFKNRDVFDRYLQLILKQQNELEEVFKELIQNRSIDTATGYTLDIIGEIVGQPRGFISVDLISFFGFQGALNAGTFGELNDVSVGSRFYSYGEPLGGNTVLDDETYRLFIKSKVIKNNTASTPEEFISLINFIFGTTQTTILSDGDGQFTVMLGRELSPLEQGLLDYESSDNGFPSRFIPKTVGVKLNFMLYNAPSLSLDFAGGAYSSWEQ